ncbi:unnamed protein product [Heterobilharzia americana]|nr:unnamed protein product [Heterobilharzia americana]
MNLTADYTICNLDNQNYTGFHENCYWHYPFYEYSLNNSLISSSSNPSSSSSLCSTGACIAFPILIDSYCTQTNAKAYNVNECNICDGNDSSIQSTDNKQFSLHSYTNESIRLEHKVDYNMISTINNHITYSLSSSSTSPPSEAGDVVRVSSCTPPSATVSHTTNNSTSLPSVWPQCSTVSELPILSNDVSSPYNHISSLKSNNSQNTSSHRPDFYKFDETLEHNKTDIILSDFSFQLTADQKDSLNHEDSSFQIPNTCLPECQQYPYFSVHGTNIPHQSSHCSELFRHPTSTTLSNIDVKASNSSHLGLNEVTKLLEQHNSTHQFYLGKMADLQKTKDLLDITDSTYHITSTETTSSNPTAGGFIQNQILSSLPFYYDRNGAMKEESTESEVYSPSYRIAQCHIFPQNTLLPLTTAVTTATTHIRSSESLKKHSDTSRTNEKVTVRQFTELNNCQDASEGRHFYVEDHSILERIENSHPIATTSHQQGQIKRQQPRHHINTISTSRTAAIRRYDAPRSISSSRSASFVFDDPKLQESTQSSRNNLVSHKKDSSLWVSDLSNYKNPSQMWKNNTYETVSFMSNAVMNYATNELHDDNTNNYNSEEHTDFSVLNARLHYEASNPLGGELILQLDN